MTRVQRKDVQVLPGANGYVNPLTGIVSYTPQDWLHRRILGVKIGNSYPERPQAGIGSADVLYEELVEGGETRFLALFLTNQASRVGPVRSVRTVDPKIVQPLGALFAYSGGVPPIVSALRSTPGVTDVGANRSGAYHRDDARKAPYNLYTSTDELWSGRDGSPPTKPMFTFLNSNDDASKGGDQTANDVRFAFAGDSSHLKYLYNTKTGLYGRYLGDNPHLVEGPNGGTQLAFRNVLVQMVKVTAGSTIDRNGTRTNDIDLSSGGSAVLFRGGHAFRGSWHRTSSSEPTTFTTTGGEQMRFAPGETIVELLPEGRELFVT